MMKKKLAIVTTGGLGSRRFRHGFPIVITIVNRLSIEFDVTVYSFETFDKTLGPRPFRIHSVPEWVRPNVLRWIYLIFLITRHCISIRPDFFYAFWGYPAGTLTVFLGRIFGRPSIVNLMGGETANVPEIRYGLLGKRIPRSFVLWTCRKASKLVAVSPTQRFILEDYGIKRQIEVIPHGVDTRLFKPIFRPLQLPLRILHVANINPVKDQQTLLQAFEIIRSHVEAKLRLVGPDFLGGKVDEMVKASRFATDIEFVGFVPYNEIVTHYQWADMFMLTSLSEGQNGAITEAMACGLLPVSTAVGIMDREFGNSVGIVTDCRDSRGMAERVIELVSDREEWEKRRRKAFEWAATHDIDWTIRQLIRVITDAREENHKRRHPDLRSENEPVEVT